MFDRLFRRSVRSLAGTAVRRTQRIRPGDGRGRGIARHGGVGLEALEARAMPTSFAFGAGILSLTLDNVTESITITATGANGYTIQGNHKFSGIDIPGKLTGDGTNLLTVDPSLAMVTALATDTKAGAEVTFAGGIPGATFDADFLVTLALPGSGRMVVDGASAFSGAHVLSAQAARIEVVAPLSSQTGAITLDADDGTQASGVPAGLLVGDTGSITTAGGAITLEGRGGDAILGDQVGVWLRGVVLAGDDGSTFGTVTVVGVGGASAGDGGGNHGVEVAFGASVASTGGAVSIVGTGSSTNGGDCGVVVAGTVSTISSPGNPGAVTIEGFGGGAAGSDGNYGVWLGGTATLTTIGGAVSITGHEGAGNPLVPFPFTTSPGIVDLDAVIGSSTGNLTFTSESLQADLSAGGSIATGGTVSIRNLVAGQQMELGPDTNPLLAAIVAPRLVIGRSDLLPLITQASAPGGALTLAPGTDLRLIGASIVLRAAIATPGSSQTFSGPVLLGVPPTPGDVALNCSRATFESTVSGGGRSLSLSGDAAFLGTVSGVADLAVAGATLTAADVATTGTQSYGGIVTLAAPLVTLSAASGTFGAGVSGGGNALAIDFGGVTAVDGASFTGLSALSTGNGGTTTITGSLSTGGLQAFGDDVLLVGDARLTTATGGTRFGGRLDGARNLVIAAGTGAVDFQRDVGALFPLASLGVQSAAGVTAAGRMMLDGTPLTASANGLVVSAGVGPVDMQVAGSSVRGYRGSGILLLASAGSRLAGFTAELNAGYGIYVQGDSSGTILAANVLRGNAIGLGLSAAGGLSVEGGNQFLGNTSYGILANGLSATTTTISGNLVDGLGVGAYGVFLDNAKNLHLGAAGAGNTIRRSSIGIQARDGLASSRITDNLVEFNGSGIVLSHTRHLAIEGANRILDNTSYGILAQGAFLDTRITGTTIERSTIGLALTGATGLVVEGGNLLRANSSQGIAVSGDSTGTLIRGNVVDGAGVGVYGVLLDGAGHLAFGGTGAGEGNSVRGTAMGLVARGLLTGSTVTANSFDGNGSGAGLLAARSLTVGGGNSFTNSAAYGVFTQGNCAGTTVSGNTIGGNDVGVGLSGTTGLTVSGGNKLTGNRSIGVYASGTAIGSRILGNVIDGGGVGVYGVFLEGAAGVAIGATGAGNTVSRWAVGINGHGVLTDAVVAANTVTGNSTGAVLASASGLLVGTGNRFGANTSYGVLAQGACVGSRISGNTIDTNVVGVCLISATGLSLREGNQILANSVQGIYASGACSGTTIGGNAINGAGAGAYGAFLDGVTGLEVGGIHAGDINTLSGSSVGIYARGVLAGTTVINNAVDGNGTGIILSSARSLAVRGGNRFIGGSAFGLYASGECVGTTVEGNSFEGNSSGVVLEGARNLTVVAVNRIVSNTAFGLYATGDSAGTTVTGNVISGNGVNVDTSAAIGGTFQTS